MGKGEQTAQACDMACFRQPRNQADLCCATFRSSLIKATNRNSDSTNASGTTYNVPRIKRGKSWPKITHIAITWRTKDAAQKSQNSHKFRFCRPHTRTPKSARNVHMIAACHLCGGAHLSRIIAAINPRAMPTQPMASSLKKKAFLEALCISLCARRPGIVVQFSR